MIKLSVQNEQDLSLAKETYHTGDHSLVIVRNHHILHSDNRSRLLPLVKGLMGLGPQAKQCTVADKVIGRAAAMVAIYFGVDQIYTPLVSSGAEKLLADAGVYWEADQVVPMILAGSGDQPCKMEQMVAEFTDPIAGANQLIDFFRSIGKL